MWDALITTIEGIMSLPSNANKGIAMAGMIWAQLTNYRMWRSIGWLLLGIFVTVLGLTIWNRKAIGSGIKTVVEAR